MNARDGMQLKFDVLRAVGASENLIKLYCPELPGKDETETIDDPEEFLDDMRDAVVELDMVLTPGRLIDIDRTIARMFLSSSEVCPYCLAHPVELGKKRECDKCSYGKMYGNCSNDISSQWHKCRNIIYSFSDDLDLRPAPVDGIAKAKQTIRAAMEGLKCQEK